MSPLTISSRSSLGFLPSTLIHIFTMLIWENSFIKHKIFLFFFEKETHNFHGPGFQKES